jgi:hypothetical protein
VSLARRATGLGLVIIGVAILTWDLGFHGPDHAGGVAILALMAVGFAVLLAGSAFLGGRGLLGSLLLVLGLVGAFLAALPDREAVPVFRFSVLAVSAMLIVAGLSVIVWLLLGRVRLQSESAQGPEPTMRSELETLAGVLRRHGLSMAYMVEQALQGSEEDIDAFLVSNELWGGSGSIADQSGIDQAREARRQVEAALVALGEAQMASGHVNPRTAGWVSAFKQWQRKGI